MAVEESLPKGEQFQFSGELKHIRWTWRVSAHVGSFCRAPLSETAQRLGEVFGGRAMSPSWADLRPLLGRHRDQADDRQTHKMRGRLVPKACLCSPSPFLTFDWSGATWRRREILLQKSRSGETI